MQPHRRAISPQVCYHARQCFSWGTRYDKVWRHAQEGPPAPEQNLIVCEQSEHLAERYFVLRCRPSIRASWLVPGHLENGDASRFTYALDNDRQCAPQGGRESGPP